MNLTSQVTPPNTTRGDGAFALEVRIVLRDAIYITLVAAALAFAANLLRKDGLPLIAKTDFEILVPCPEPLGSAVAIAPGDASLSDATTLLIDARASGEYASWHHPAAISDPFDWLAEQEQITREAQIVARRVARSAKHAVVVYGDGGDPDSGQQWAALLNTAGIRNVTFVSGGSIALRKFAEPKAQP